jgi:CHAD domain-containing protein
MAYTLEPDESVREGILRCAREQLDTAVGALHDEIADDPVKAVHAARKALKKERSLLRLARGAMPPKQRRRENAALRSAGRDLSAARDAEAMIQTLKKLSERFTGQLPENAFIKASEPLQRERDAQRRQLVDSAVGPHAAQQLEANRTRIGDWTLRRGGWSALKPGLERSYRRGRRAMRDASRDRSVDGMHEWRKRAKDLWYQERLLAAVGGPALTGQAEDLHRLADLLGDDHDLGVLRRRLADVHAPVDIDGLLALIDHRRSELQTKAFGVGRRVYAERPREFIRRTRLSWEAGRKLSAALREQDPADLAHATRAGSVD